MGMTLDLVTPNRKVILDFPVSSVSLPGALGDMQILPNHTSLVSTLKTGVVQFFSEKDNMSYIGAISYGFLEVTDNKVTILANTFELANEIDVSRAEKALKLAGEKLKQPLDDSSFQKYQLKLERAMIRLQASKRA